jgi:hypothetical protein
MMKHFRLIVLTLTVVAAAIATRGEEPREKGWRVQAGWVHQWGRGMDVRSGSPMLSRLPRSAGAPALTYPDDSAYTNRVFDDGYVFLDPWTTDPGLIGSERYGMTWNWGYQNSSQYDNVTDPENPTLTFHIDQGFVTDENSPVSAEGGTGGKLPSDGIELKVKRWLHTWEDRDIDLDLVLGLAWFKTDHSNVRRTYTQNGYNISEAYTYLDYFGTPAGGSWPWPFSPPDTYSGDYTGPGPLLPGTPIDSSLIFDSGTIRDSVLINGRLRRLRGEAGLSFIKPLTQRLNAYFEPQFVLEFVDAKVSRTETLTFTEGNSEATTQIASTTEKKSKARIVPGFLLTAGADYRFSENWYVGASLGWEWLFRDVEVNVGPDQVNFDLEGGEFSLYLGRHF